MSDVSQMRYECSESHFVSDTDITAASLNILESRVSLASHVVMLYTCSEYLFIMTMSLLSFVKSTYFNRAIC